MITTGTTTGINSGDLAMDSPPALDFDDHAFQTDPWPTYEWYRLRQPVSRSPQTSTYFVFGYANVRTVLGSPDFCTYHPFRRSRPTFGVSLLDTDGAEHDAGAGVADARAVRGAGFARRRRRPAA
jgi:cytochrome P450